jgi:hypothetical protein
MEFGLGIRVRRVPGLDAVELTDQPKGLLAPGQLEMQLKY